MSSSLSIIDLSWDIDWFIKSTGVANHFGYEIKDSKYHFRYLTSDYDAVMAAIDAYPTAYLEVLAPTRIENVVVQRKKRLKSYTMGGITIELDQIAESRLAGAALLLMRNEDLAEINWDTGNGVFVTIPRDNMLALADAVGLYIQSCFTYSKTLINQIKAAANVTECNAIDINAGWPT